MSLAVKAAIIVVGMLAGVTAAPWLWYREMIELPAVAVRGMGRVAGVMSSIHSAAAVQLPVVFHKQEHSLSCEVATLKMALSRYGIDVSESELIDGLPFDRTPKEGGVWGNPHQGFVGNIDGTMLVDGYGVYWDPIAKLGLRYRRTEVLRGASLADIAGHLAEGRPIIVWGYFGRLQGYSWNSSTGEKVYAVNGEHTRVVTGFSGDLAAPTSFSLIDPIFGPMSWSSEKFLENWSPLGRHAVVVYPHPRWVQAAGDGRVWEISKDGTTRHWVSSWQAFVESGGFTEAIQVIDRDELLKYKQGPDVEI